MYYSTLHNINLFPKDQYRNHTMGETPGTVNTIGIDKDYFSYTYSLCLCYRSILHSSTLFTGNLGTSSKPKAITNLKLQFNEYFHQ